MAGRSKIAAEAFEIAQPVAKEMGFDLVDAEYKKEGQSIYLRLFIDKKGGISIDECELFSKVIDPIFDEKLKNDADFFEVSSPGLTRPLQTKEDFLRCLGQKADVSLFKEVDGTKNFTAVISGVEDDEVIFEKDSKTSSRMKLEELARVVLHIDF